MDSLKNKLLVMIVGPTAIGKSSLMNCVASTNPDYAYVRSFTTRPPREGEDSHYQFITRDEAADILKSGQAITYFEHPTTSHIYGTTAASYPATYNLLDTLSVSVDEYRKLPFERTVTISVTASPSSWQRWLLKRFPSQSNDAQQRLIESRQSIRWSLNDDRTNWLINSEGQLQQVSDQLTELVALAENRAPSPPPTEPYAMLELIEGEILWPKR